MSRFDYVKYDQRATEIQASFKASVENISLEVELRLKSPEAKALIHVKLQEAYMWIGKAIRDDQIARHGSAELQEERSDS